ncbi:MAG: TonB-dependent receptor plug domain-containing protein, partial [Burkholderiales bacterium]|nr:TonB-dependent receptor plug domain-containing protein [Burkholderiales bacterium]
MNCKPTPVAMAVAVAMMALTVPAYGDDASTTTQKQDQTNPDAITVTGIRASKQKSLATKRHADVIEEVVSAEDIGKMPDKNIADAVERLPGVTIQSGASGTGGAFDEADRVGLRGSSPSLTLTSINGHAASSGDWYVLDQTGNLVGRSMSYSLLPSELVGRVEVKKDPEASDLEGGVAGAVDIQTRKPLDFKKNFGAEMSLGAVYSSLPGKTDPQFNALFNWKNEAGTVGLIAQPFYE